MISMRVVAVVLMFSLLWGSLHLLKSEGCPPQEKAALMMLKASLERSNCTPPTSWDEAVDCCAWERVECSNTSTSTSSRRVTALHLSNLAYYFTGSDRYHMEWHLMNFDLFKSFRALRYLDLSYNDINGSLASQDFTALRKLTYLDLSYNHFTVEIPSFLTAMPSLRVLKLAYNSLRGSLPVEDFNALRKLTYLDLSYNEFMDWHLMNFTLFKSFRALRYLDLSRNWINGSLASQGYSSLPSPCRSFEQHDPLHLNAFAEDFTALRKLTYLDLSYNDFSGEIPTSLTTMPSLQVLKLSYNGLPGSLPVEVLMGLPHLRELQLQGNRLRLPPWLGNHSKIRYIDLSRNSLKGKLPQHTFSGLTSLQHIDLSDNLLDGSIPPLAFSNLTSLERLDLSDNLFHGNFPLPSLANLSKLQQITLSHNTHLGLETNFQHSVASFQLRLLALSNCNLNTNFLADTAFLSSLHNLEVIDLSNNNLSGSLPDWFLKNFTRLVYVILRNNTLSGQIHLPTKTIASLQEIDLSMNHIGGFLPSNFGLTFPSLLYLDLSMNHLVGCMPSSFQNISELDTLILRRNHFHGHIQPHVCGLRQLRILDLSQNNFSGTLPSCSTPLDLVYLNLGGNDFRGSFSGSFVGTTSLELLDVGNNKFSGPLPGWFGNLVFPRILLLGENNFEGSIPTQLCKMQSLQLLDLHKNKFSGSIPPCLGNMMYMKTELEEYWGLLDAYINTSALDKSYESFRARNIRSITEMEEVVFFTKGNSYPYYGEILAWMIGIDLSSNRLTGGIPSDIGNLARIKALNFSNNYLTGSIPESFSRLKDIESLDLSHNHLSGAIPWQLSQLISLEVFSVAYNNLSGCTPELKYQFGTFGVESYEGNAGLHGPPLTNSCFPDSSPQNVPQKVGEGGGSDAMNDIIFYGMMVVSSILFFWVTVAVLHLNSTGQRICSNITDRCVDITIHWVSMLSKMWKI